MENTQVKEFDKRLLLIGVILRMSNIDFTNAPELKLDEIKNNNMFCQGLTLEELENTLEELHINGLIAKGSYGADGTKYYQLS